MLVWLHGTGAETGDQRLARDVVREAAAAGWLAVFPTYVGAYTMSSNLGIDYQAKCVFRRSNTSRSALAEVCGRPKADCSRVVVAGHSQGGMIAMRAANHDPNVRAAWATSVFNTHGDSSFWASTGRGGKRALRDTNLRLATGLEDMEGISSWFNGASYAHLRTFTGQSCEDRVQRCLRADGSGWWIVPHRKPPDGPTDGYADHCFMSQAVAGQAGTRCYDVMITDPSWLEGEGPWTLRTVLAWLSTRYGRHAHRRAATRCLTCEANVGGTTTARSTAPG